MDLDALLLEAIRFLGVELELEPSIRFRFLAEGRVKNEDMVEAVEVVRSPRKWCCEAVEV